MKNRTNYNLIDGVVVDTADPQQMGRVKIWCPAIDGQTYEIINLPWSNYVSPFAGQTLNYPGGAEGAITAGYHSYGFWAIPKIGATVMVAILYGDVNCRYYMGSTFGDHGNRSLPAGRNRPAGPMSDTLDPVEPTTSNLKAQFSNKLDSPQAQSRGAYERQVAQDRDLKDGTEGYSNGVVKNDLDPQTYCLTTPARHTILFQDSPINSRVRIRSSGGHQIIMDDANERIYISTNQGKSWIEMDSDGHIHLYSSASVSIGAGEDINMAANGSINLNAGGDINLGAGGSLRLTGCSDTSISGKVVNITSGGQMNILAAGALLASASAIHLNGPGATSAPCANKPTVIPNHEPWERPVSKNNRGPNWKK